MEIMGGGAPGVTVASACPVLPHPTQRNAAPQRMKAERANDK
jgi:hypothetical protein